VEYPGEKLLGLVVELKGGWGMRSRLTFSIAAVFVLLASTNASGDFIGAFSNSDAKFSHDPCTLPVVCSGQGTNTFSWGDFSSTLTFRGTTFNTKASEKFVMGHLDFVNSMLTSGTEVSSVDLTFGAGDVTATDPDSAFNTFYDNWIFTLTLAIDNTPNTADPVASRDNIVVTKSLETIPGLGTRNSNVTINPNVFSVNEDASNSVDLQFCFCSFEFVGFGEVANPALGAVSFLPIPGPSTLALLGGGFVALALTRRRRSGAQRH
jgi:hypothetical protein